MNNSEEGFELEGQGEIVDIANEGEQLLPSKNTIKQLSLQALQLILVSLAIYKFNVEAHLELPKLMFFVCGVFVIHAILPRAYRSAFFFFASLVPIFYFFGWQEASLLIAFALLLIGACHLPIALTLRKLIVLFLGGGLVYCRYLLEEGTYSGAIPLSSQLVSLLGVMFMFRMILYLYELKHEKEKVSVWQRLSYFFSLPNICFPIFPIVDYKAFKRTYYDQQDLIIYQRGINLVILGMIQLLIYRVVYYLTPSVANVTGFWLLLKYLTLSYLLLLRLNGILNIAVGLLRLFGFNLPDIFNYMYLASGFDDLWRRVNIYWKDFLVKIVYYPIYFRLRKKGTMLALVIGTMGLFAFNWFFHAYQWFWVLGEFPLRPTELITWVLLGSFVLLSILNQKKKSGTSGSILKTGWSKELAKAAAILGTFGGMSLLYSLYISPSLKVWLRTLGTAGSGTLTDWLVFLMIILSFLFVGAAIFRTMDHRQVNKVRDFFQNKNRLTLINLVILLGILFSTSSVVDRGFRRLTGYSTRPFINHHLNLMDQRKQFNGYYEEIMFADNFSSPLWAMEHKKPTDWRSLKELELIRTRNFLQVLTPSAETTFKNAKFTTNRWGLRDQEYEKMRPENTQRMAIIGGSGEMGAGVKNEEVFEQLVEDRLSEEFGSDTTHFELLNFAISGNTVLRNIEIIRRKALEFQPQTVLVFVHKNEEDHAYNAFRWLAGNEDDVISSDSLKNSIPWLKAYHNLLEKEQIKSQESPTTREVKEAGLKILDWGYEYMEQLCRESGAQMLLVYYPSILKDDKVYYLPYQKLAEKNNIPFINLKGIFDNYSLEELQIAPWDTHVNTKGHQLIADELYLKLVAYLNLK